MQSCKIHGRTCGSNSAVWSRFDVSAFYLEARRVLKPGGSLVAWCYYFPHIKEHCEADAILQKFKGDIFGPHMTEVQHRCEKQYRGLEPSKEDFGVVERAGMPFEQQSTVWHLVRVALNQDSHWQQPCMVPMQL